MKKKLYVYALPDQMVDHMFTDDVAICKARSKKEAISIFRSLYELADKSNVKRLRWHGYNVRVLTSY